MNTTDTTTPPPTPETDSEYKEAQDFPRSDFVVPLAQFLEVKRERDEARDQLEAMREAIREAYEALEGCTEDSGELLAERGWWKDEPRCDYQVHYNEHKQRIEDAEATLTKLQPFIS